MAKTAIIIGATGLVGSHLVKELLSDDVFETVKVFGRRSVGYQHPKLQEFICDFEQLDKTKENITGDILFSSLGTTLKQAGSKAQQYKVDFTYQYEFACLAAQNGIKQYMLVSSASANARSKMFYLRIKGELEQKVQALTFSSIQIIQPSGLVGQREHRRRLEEVGNTILSGLVKIIPPLRKYRSIEGSTVARAMHNNAKKEFPNRITTIGLDELFSYAESTS